MKERILYPESELLTKLIGMSNRRHPKIPIIAHKQYAEEGTPNILPALSMHKTNATK